MRVGICVDESRCMSPLATIVYEALRFEGVCVCVRMGISVDEKRCMRP
jgi:hypothetical protein